LLHALQAISRGVTKAGVGVDTLNLEVVTLEDVVAAIKKADGFILGAALMGFVF
jgi:flavorubredoxin